MQHKEVFAIAIVSSLATYVALRVMGAVIASTNSPPPPPARNQALNDAKRILERLSFYNAQCCDVVIGIGGRSEAALAVLEGSFQSVRYMGGSIGCYSGVVLDPCSDEKCATIFVDAGTQGSDVDTAREKIREWGGTVAHIFILT